MSHFLDENCPFLTPTSFQTNRASSKQKKQEKIGHRNNQQLQILDYYFQKEVTQCINLSENDKFIKVSVVHKGTVGQRMVILQKVSYDKTLRWWQNSIQVMDKSNSYLRIHNTDKIIYIYKYFLKKLARCSQFPIKLSISPTNGIIKIRLTYIIPNFTKEFNSKSFSIELQKIVEQTANFLSKNEEILMQIYDFSNKQITSKPKELPANIKKHMNKFGVYISLGTPETQPQNQLNQNQQLQSSSRLKILQKHQTLLPEDKKMLELYQQYDQVWDKQLTQQELQFKCFQREEVKQRVKMPGVTKCRNIYQNNYILNSIKINKYLQINPLPIKNGGFTNIYLAQVQFWYVHSENNEKVVAPINNESFTPDKLLKKTMVIKREQRKERATFRDRIKHQKNILQQIKSGNALFIPKYYLSTDDSLFKQDLLSDFVMLPNLIEYVLANKLTLSLSSKVYIMFTLVQSLRYLKFYRIVHLDLKPNNIMISRTMMVKIIDFGQSYHPKICPQVYAPGFTMPYSSPQSYYPSESFSEKNDIFSIGVISYQILYGRFPFFLYNQNTHSEIYKYKEYTDHWFYNPEELKGYGDNEVFPILQLIFGRCLDPNPARRPQLDWLSLVLRECIDFYV